MKTGHVGHGKGNYWMWKVFQTRGEGTHLTGNDSTSISGCFP